jgi:hypothetical protein
MAQHRNKAGLGGISARLALGGAVLGLLLPSAGLALGGLDGRGITLAARGSFAAFTPASVDPVLARLLSDHTSAKGRLMRFTPAGAANRPDRSVTVAVRVDDATANAISVRSAIAAAQGAAGKGEGTLVLTPARFNLGMARGYKSFAPQITAPVVQRIEMPDLSTFAPAKKEADANKPGRFNARIAVEEKGIAGRAPRTLDALGARSLDVGGSYRLLRNLDVTAGVRYSQERDRISPLTDGRQDSQAVYVGTQFRF